MGSQAEDARSAVGNVVRIQESVRAPSPDVGRTSSGVCAVIVALQAASPHAAMGGSAGITLYGRPFRHRLSACVSAGLIPPPLSPPFAAPSMYVVHEP